MCVVCVFCNMNIAFQTFCLDTYLRSILNCIHPLLFYVFNERHILNSVFILLSKICGCAHDCFVTDNRQYEY